MENEKQPDIDEMIREGRIHLPNGQVVGFRRIPPALITEWRRQHRPPEPPMREAEVMGGGTEMVPDEKNPAYQAAMAEYAEQAALVWMDLMFGHLEIELPKDDEWVETVESYWKGLKVPTSKRGKTTAYLKYVVLDSPDALDLVSSVMARASGVYEGSVEKAMDSFQLDVAGRADQPVLDEEPTADVRRDDVEQPDAGDVVPSGVADTKATTGRARPRVRTKRKRKV